MNSLRRLLISAVMIVLCLMTGATGQEQKAGEDRAAEAAKLIAQEIAKVKLWSGTTDDAISLPRSESSILHWTNPTQGTIYGDVFVWTKNGRAQAVVSVVKGYSPFMTMSMEFQSFSREPLQATYGGKKIWAPKVGDVAFASLEGAPTPAEAKWPD